MAAFAAERISVLTDPGAAIDKKFAEVERRLVELEKERIVLVGEKSIRIGLNGNASSWVLNPYVYQGRWVIRGFHLDMIAKGEGQNGGAAAGVETEFRQADVDFIVCTPAVDQVHVIIKAYKRRAG